MIKIIALIVSFGFAVGCGKSSGKKDQADDLPGARTLEELKASFQSSMPQYEELFARAKTLNYRPEPLFGPPIDQDACEKLKDRIRSAYPGIDPFDQAFEGGGMKNDICGETAGTFAFYDTWGTTQLGLTFKHVLRKKIIKASPSRETTHSYYFDESFRMVATQVVVFERVGTEVLDGKALEFGVGAIDEAGNAFFNYEEATRDDGERKGLFELQTVALSDGMMPELSRSIHRDASDAGKSRRVDNFDRSDDVSWSRFFLPLTFAEMGGIYEVGGKLYSRPVNLSSLFTVYRDGKEICNLASVRRGAKVTSLDRNECD